jgi:uncharacterized protein
MSFSSGVFIIYTALLNNTSPPAPSPRWRGGWGVRYIKETIMALISREFQIFVKPAGPLCNLQCGYCYYLDKKELYPGKMAIRMPDELLEQYILQLIEASTDGPVFFSWHGGEPLLAGIEFYRKAVKLQRKYLPPGRTLVNGIQTNGTLLNEEWCRFLAEEKFMVGISIDGTERLHNTHRSNSLGNGTFIKVKEGFELLVSHGVIPEVLCVVHAANVRFPLEIYRFFKSLGAAYLTFLPLVERISGSPEDVTPESVCSEDFGKFLTAIFDEWVENDIGRIKVQIFEEAIRTAFNLEHTLCIFKKQCGGVPVVEFNGDFYSCDHYVRKDHFLGNIRDHSLSWFLDHPAQKAFGEGKSGSLPGYCRNCSVLDMCNGECPKNRFIRTSGGETGLNYLCRGYQLFFNHCRPFVEAVREVAGQE